MFAYVNGMETVAFRLPEPLKKRVEQHADQIGESTSVAGRRLLRVAFDAQQELEEHRAENERLQTENERLKAEKADTRQNQQADTAGFTILTLGAFLIGTNTQMAVTAFGGISTGAVGLALIVIGVLVSRFGTNAYRAINNRRNNRV